MTGRVRRIIIGGLAGIGCLGISVLAQESLTLEAAIARGLAHSARLAELQAREAGADATVAGRAAATRPIVSAQAGYTRTNHVEEYSIVAPGQPPRVLYPDVPDNYRSRIDLQWPIYTAGRADALQRAALAERQAAGEDLAAARADLVLEITRAFWALVTARDTERVLGGSLTSLDAHVGDLKTRLDQGLISPHELLSAQAQRSRQRVASIEAAAARQTAEADLRRLIGGDGGPILPVEKGAATVSTEEASAEKVAAPVSRPERRALDQRLTAAREREIAIHATGRPQIFIGGGYDYARPNPRIFPRADRWEDSWDASVNVSWTLWDGGRRAAERAEAAASARALSARITEFDRQVTFEIEARRLDVESSRAAIEAAREGIDAAVEARRVLGERYQAGVATSTDVLDAEVAVLQAELDRTRAVAAFRLAEARLARAIGEPTKK
ncbi:MAG: TolC family protein [Vicinamibacterales bacterium]